MNDQDIIREHYKRIGKAGGLKRLANLTPEQRSKIARKGGRANKLRLSLLAKVGTEQANTEA